MMTYESGEKGERRIENQRPVSWDSFLILHTSTLILFIDYQRR